MRLLLDRTNQNQLDLEFLRLLLDRTKQNQPDLQFLRLLLDSNENQPDLVSEVIIRQN